jgi:hypothetical protein
MSGPFGFPWSTFSALIVVAASVVLAVVWSILTGRRGGGPGDE